MTIWERVANALSPLNVPFGQSVFIPATPGGWPEQFLVCFLVSAPPAQVADDRVTLTQYRVQVSIYSRTGLAQLPDVAGAMLAAGFVKGPSRELPYDDKTRHFGLAKDFVYLEEE